MKAYLNNTKVKEKYLTRVTAHEKADEIIKGQYWQDGKGCAVGCTIHSSNHTDYEKLLGIPRIIARLEDNIFEQLPNELAMTWPRRFLEAVPVGADLSMVWPKMAVWLLTDPIWGVLQFAKREQSKKSIQDVSDAYEAFIKDQTQKIDWSKLRSAAADAAYAGAAAAYDDAAYAAAAADAAAAYADAAYADAVAREKWRVAQSEKLLELLKDAK